MLIFEGNYEPKYFWQEIRDLGSSGNVILGRYFGMMFFDDSEVENGLETCQRSRSVQILTPWASQGPKKFKMENLKVDFRPKNITISSQNIVPEKMKRTFELLKFIHSEKCTKFCEIFTLRLTTVHTVKSKVKAKFCGLLRIHEL